MGASAAGARTHTTPRPAGTSSAPGTPSTSGTPGTPSTSGTRSAPQSSALVVFLPTAANTRVSASDAIERELGSIPTLSTGILSATQGAYTTAQFVLDMTQGARVSNSSYKPSKPPTLSLSTVGAGPSNGFAGGQRFASGQIQPWGSVRKRAAAAPQLLSPGLLGAQIPHGGAYVGPGGADGALAADRDGRVAAVSLGSAATLLARVAALLTAHRLVVADLPSGTSGYADLRTLAAARPANELLVVLERPSDEPGHELLWSAFAGLGGGGRTLTSQTTNQRGLIASIDIGPTILGHLQLAVPADMRGKPVRLDGPLHGSALRSFKARLEVIGSRRLPAASWLVGAWILLLVVMRVPLGSGPQRRARNAWTLRVGALAIMWAPVGVLVPALIEPGRSAEFAVLVATCFCLAALTDLFVRWPRAPIVPAVTAVVVLTVDALAGTQLLVRSLLGPDPLLGARFYGIGNELKSSLAVLVFTGVAAALYPAVRGRRAAMAMACAGILLAVVEGSARIGAGVGGVILVSAGTAVATTMLLPGAVTRKRLLVVIAAPLIGLVALAAIDLATAHGSGHFTGSVLDARSPGDIRDLIVRRYGAAYDELKNHLMPFATALALLASAIAVRRRDRICAPVDSDPAWLAALGGGLAAGLVGALSEDSGPVLLVIAVFVLGCVLGYLWGKPLPVQAATPHSSDIRPAARSRARTQSAAPSG